MLQFTIEIEQKDGFLVAFQKEIKQKFNIGVSKCEVTIAFNSKPKIPLKMPANSVFTIVGKFLEFEENIIPEGEVLISNINLD